MPTPDNCSGLPGVPFFVVPSHLSVSVIGVRTQATVPNRRNDAAPPVLKFLYEENGRRSWMDVADGATPC
jgi:hypothetical protein